MSRLVAFGCSLTYGHALEIDQNKASNFSWPYITAKELERSCVNISSSGASNKRIWYNIINFKFEPADLVVILWTYPYRSALIKEDEIFDLNLNEQAAKNRYLNHFKLTYDEHDSNLMSKLFVNHIDLFLKHKGINAYHLVWSKEYDYILDLNQNLTKNIPLYFSDVYWDLPRALDNSHPGIEAHQQFGKKVSEFIR